MEPVTIKRYTVTQDAYGNDVEGELLTVGTILLLVAPQVQDEPKLLGRTAVVTNYNLYNRGAASGILPDDILTVRGEDTPVDGRIAVWRKRDGTLHGEHIQVRLVSG